MQVTHQTESPNYKHFLDWIKRGYHQNMWYLAEKTRKEKRKSAKRLFEPTKSILVGAISYHTKQPHATSAKFARYGWGLDYHQFMKEKFLALQTYMQKELGLDFESKTVVDTAPILERDFAQLAGVGWIGKNTMIMNQQDGSYLYLGLMLTSLDLQEDQPVSPHCGTCTACIDACPTDAIEQPFVLNPQKCISYQTIENRKEKIPDEVAKKLDGWVAGCDICQEVCPWNHKASVTDVVETKAKKHTALSLEKLSQMSQKEYKTYFSHSAFSRLGHQKIVQNALAALKATSSNNSR